MSVAMSLIEDLNRYVDEGIVGDSEEILLLLSKLKKTAREKNTPILESEEIEFIKMLYTQDRSQ